MKKPYDLESAMIAKIKAEIMAQEDQHVFMMLDGLAPTCQDKYHTAYGKLLETCENISCISRHIHIT